MKYLDGNIYHIYNRGANKAKLFWCKRHFEFCRDLLTKNAEKHGVSLLAFCLMPNHYHLLMRQEHETSLSDFLKATFIAYTLFVNAREGHSGTLFQGRAQSRHIESDDYVIMVTRYIHLNPVLAHLVHKPEEWEYSDCKDWIASDPYIVQDPKQKKNYEFQRLYFSSGLEYKHFINENLNNQKFQQCSELYEGDF
jgi:putative transposase